MKWMFLFYIFFYLIKKYIFELINASKILPLNPFVENVNKILWSNLDDDHEKQWMYKRSRALLVITNFEF
jgi:hypothetical protein